MEFCETSFIVKSSLLLSPKAGTGYSVELLEDPQSIVLDKLSQALRIRKLGWIFTDLESERNGKVAFKRNIVS